MNRCLLFFLLAIILVPLSANNAQSARFTGAYLLDVCEMDENGNETVQGGHATCQSYISGVVDYHNVLQALRLAPKVDICVPQSKTMNDIHKVVLNFLRKHPEHDAFIAAPAVTMALFDVYPCK